MYGKMAMLGVLAIPAILAQQRAPNNKPSPAGPPPLVKFTPLPDNHAARLGATIAGSPGVSVRLGARPIYVAPYFNPYYGEAYSQPAAPMVILSQPAAPAAAPVVVVNPDYRPETPRPVMSEYFAESKPYENLPAPGQTVYLLSLKDGSLRQAVAYWREAEKLRYVQPDHKQQSVPFATVDRESTQRFNRERGIEIRLPE